MKAFCWRKGQIGFGRSVPEGALLLAKAPADKLRKAVEGSARLAHDNKTFLVPGVPEADSDEAACDATIIYRDRLERTLGHAGMAASRHPDIAIYENLRGVVCVCGARKKARQSFCRRDYFRLPVGTREALYVSEGYPNAFRSACELLLLTPPGEVPAVESKGKAVRQ